jgi:hypothetical protein
MKADQFEVISEPCSDNGAEMLDGCGFIPDSMLLEIVEKMGKAHIVSWTEDERSFVIYDVDAFLIEVVPYFFS